MAPRPDTRPGRPLDDDWLFADPMTLDLAGGADVREPAPVEAAGGRSVRPHWRFRLLVSALIFAAGTLAGALLTKVGPDPIGVSATACPQAPPPLAGANGPGSGRNG